ncbi:MAG: glycosyltransferase family 2 protein, partial [Pseudomonadota bacterium]|nr:glycosyltransferase family 2 protein [Pseudomonadota bacterium]
MKFSVVIANYNYGHMLSRAIDSVLNQTESDIEIIVVDDGSTDNSKDVIALYQPRIRAYFQENSGQSTAYNKGADAATGDYVLFLDADDELLPNAFELFSEALKNLPDIDYLFAGYISVDEKGREKTRKATPLPATKRDILIAYLSKELVGINNGGGIIKREVFESLRYPEGLRNNTDIVFLGQVLANKSAASIPQPVVKIHAHGARVRRNSKVVLDAGLLSVDALFNPQHMPDDLMDLKSLYLTRRLLSLFRVCYKSQSYGLAREYYRQSVAANIGTLLQWSYTRKFLISLFKKDNMEKHSSVLLQIRHSPEGLMDTCNQYLEMHSSADY